MNGWIGKTAAMLAALAACAGLTAQDSLDDAIQEGDFSLSFRYRYEFVDQDGFSDNAEASTLLSRLTYQMREWHGWQFSVEVDNVTGFLFQDFNSGAGSSNPARARFPVVADPDGTEVNQAWLNYDFSERAGLRFGRQRIVLDNQRFIGGVAWRQNEQTYDALSLTAKPGGDGELFVAYVFNVNRIFGNTVPAGDHDQDTVLAHYHWPLTEAVDFTGYFYSIANNDAPGFSTQTAGLLASGDHRVEPYVLSWRLEWAHQTDHSNNPVDYSANYWRLDGGVGWRGVRLYSGWEVLEGDRSRSGAAFRTPLATLHAFNGWADQFLTTPDDGLQDWFVGVSGKTHGFEWNVIWHDLSARSGGREFGWELDASLSRQFNKRVGLLLKAAFFDAEDAAFVDTNKLWLMLSYRY